MLVLGAGTFAEEVTDLIADRGWDVIAYIVNVGGIHVKAPVMSPEQALIYKDKFVYIPGFVSNKRHILIEEMQRLEFVGGRLQHKSASVSKKAYIRPCTTISRLVAVGNNAYIEWGVILNRGCTIGHDCYVGYCATIGPGANLAGGVTVYSLATVGMGANILEGCHIGIGATVGAGSVVTCDIPDGETWWGVPARRMR